MRFNHQQQQHVEELCGASIRALTGLPGLHHRGRTLFLDGKRVNTHAPHLQTDVLEQDFRSHRGISDGIALRLQHSDEQLHQSLCPPSPIARLRFCLSHTSDAADDLTGVDIGGRRTIQ